MNDLSNVKQDVFLLLDSIREGWTKCLPTPYGDGAFSSAIDGMTDCNRFVNFVCMKMGYLKFVPDGETLPIKANQMMDYMLEHLDEWREMTGAVAQWNANRGLLVIAGWKNPDGGHGHVCIVQPGVLGESEKWKSNQVPKVANVSTPELCRIDRGANWAFSSQPRYFGIKL